MIKRGFASDNNSGVHPDVLEAIADANQGHVIGYGDDTYTHQAEKLFKKHFSPSCQVFFMLTGTGANVLSVDAVNRSFNAVICPETAHIYEDECGAPEKFTGCKLLPVETENGKLTPELIKYQLKKIGFEHHVQPGLVSVSQATELGTVYTHDELKALTGFAHKNNMLVHVDGARIANAAISLKTSFKNMITDTGVDILSFGGTKNGMMFGEAVVVMNDKLVEGIKYRRKQSMQLYSKMRFVSAQFIAYLQNDVWKKNAEHANNMATMLYQQLKGIPGIEPTQKVESNAVFAIVPKEIIPVLQEAYFFYVWDEFKNEVRWMTSFDTTADDITGFVNLVRKLLS